MRFDWDNGNTGHLTKHKVSPEEAEQVIENNPLDLTRRIVNGEERVLHLGETAVGRVLVVVATERDGLIRVVTAYPAKRAMRKIYAALKDTDNDTTAKDP
jgi:uncharacterized DUF497 family protein